MFEVRHLFNYTPSYACLAFSRLWKVGMSAAPIPCPRNYPRQARLSVVNASAAGRSS